MRFLFFEIFVVLQCLSCVASRGYLENPMLPTSFSGMFHACSNVEGETKMKIVDIKKGERIDFDIDWLSGQSSWNFDVVNRIGQTLLKGEYRDGKFKKFLPSEFDQLQIESKGEEGYVYVNGTFVGFRALELPCVLNASLPFAWSNKIVGLKSLNDTIGINVYEKIRDIQISAEGIQSAKIKRMCYEIKWSRFLGLAAYRVGVCHDYNENNTFTRIDVDDRYTIEWTNLK